SGEGLRSGGRGAGWRATLRRSPAAAIVINSEDPPNDTNGNVTPVRGRTPTTPPMFITAWTRIQAVTPPARGIPKPSRACNEAWIPNEPNTEKRAHTAITPT